MNDNRSKNGILNSGYQKSSSCKHHLHEKKRQELCNPGLAELSTSQVLLNNVQLGFGLKKRPGLS